jgi:glycosyltransferase involved in cell wall biosynthesis
MKRVMLILDAYRVSSPAKGVLDFCEAAGGRLDPLIVVFQRGGQQPTELREECARRGLPVEVLRERWRFDPAAMFRALQVARSFSANLVETNGYKADVAGLLLQRRLGLPWVAVSHGVTDEGPKVRMYWLADRALIRRADRIVAVSEARRRMLLAEGCPPSRLVTIHNAVVVPPPPGEASGTVRKMLGLETAGPTVAVVGRLSPEKGQEYFLEAMVDVARAVPGVTGLIVGEGQEEPRLRARTDVLGLSGVVRFIGYRRDMDSVYPAVDVIVLPSLSEGLPMVALEAMARRIPVVATRVGGVPEAVEDGESGFLVPRANPRALADTIVKLLLDPMRRRLMGTAGRERVERRFSIVARTEQMLSLYADVTGLVPATAG